MSGMVRAPQRHSIGSTPRGSEFQAVVKKIPSYVPWTKHRPKGPARFSQGNGAPVSGWGRGSGVFSACVRRSSSITTMPGGWSYPLQVEFFYEWDGQWMYKNILCWECQF
jgi:hypothetical protein